VFTYWVSLPLRLLPHAGRQPHASAPEEGWSLQAMKILLVEDDVNLLDVTAYALRREGFSVIPATDGVQALTRWEADRPNMVVLDIGLPRMDGLDVCRRIRQSGPHANTPVILLTGRTAEEDVLTGFRAGADDYVTKPFSPAQLAMRIRAVWRRGGHLGALEPSGELRVGDLTLDRESHEVWRGEEMVRLTPIEFRLLYMLATNAGRVVSAARLVEYAWDYAASDSSLLKTHICHVRKKLRLRRGQPGDIRAVPHVGYRLIADPKAG
jgi:DNA-binding response OmpR family regulator